MDESKYLVVAFYCLTPIENPEEEVRKHLNFVEPLDILCRIYISAEGINGQMSGLKSDAIRYMQWLNENPRFASIYFQCDPYPEHVFPKKTIKYRPQLVALDTELDLQKRGEYLAPEQWKEKLEQRDEKTLLLDVRNDYEWKVGHFEGASLPALETFRQFPAFAKQLEGQVDKKETTVMMYCTGGIRCELYSALLKEQGFEKVYQLKGGIINYGHQVGSAHWKGKLFVFDDRMTVPISEENKDEVITTCIHCPNPSDVYYNCANMDCNELFTCCTDCAERLLGCCCVECKSAEKLRPYVKGERPKPFRKWMNYFK